MSKHLSRKTLASIAMVITLTALGCASDMNSDNGAGQMSAGLTEARNGLSKTQSGVDAFTAGSRQPGLTDISDGMGMMDKGTTDMRKGMGMMSGGMMMNCADGGSDTVIQPIQAARDEMQKGQSMMGIVVAPSDDEAISHMQNGMGMMKTALDQAQTTMGCMGHSNMM